MAIRPLLKQASAMWVRVILVCAVGGAAFGGLMSLLNSSTWQGQNPYFVNVESEYFTITEQIGAILADLSRLNTTLPPVSDSIPSAESTPVMNRRLDLLTDYVRLNERRLFIQSERTRQVPAWVSVIFSVLVGLGVGSGIGGLIAYFVEFRDRTFRTAAQTEKRLAVQVLGALPTLRTVAGNNALSNYSDQFDPYRRLAARLLPDDDHPTRSILITSANADEGKSLTALHLGAAFARYGKNALVIDADLRTPTLHKWAGLSNRDGLANMIFQYSTTLENEIAPLIQPYIKTSSVEGLSILTSGPLPAQPGDLLGSAKLPSLLAALNTHFEIVLIDGPALLEAGDMLTLMHAVDGVVFLVDARRTRLRAAKQALRLIKQERGRLFGVALNRASRAETGGS